MLDQFFSRYNRRLTAKIYSQGTSPQKKEQQQEKSKNTDGDRNKRNIELKFHKIILKNIPDEDIREYTHIDSDENSLHKLGYYWPQLTAAQLA